MKNTILKVIEQNDFDRYIFINYYNDEIIGLNFWQGIGESNYQSLMDSESFKPCNILTEIFKRTKGNMKTASDEERINRAIELYIHAFILQDDEIYVKHSKALKNQHIAFLEGYVNAWEKLSETSQNEDWIDGFSALYVDYCKIHNLPKLSALDLIYKLNKI
jgi:hypothetical protein